MIEFSQRLRALPGYPLAEIPTIKRRLQDAGVDVIDLGAGDNDAPPDDGIVAAMRAATGEPALSKYGFQQGLPEYRRAASRWVERRFGVRFDPTAELLPLIGSKEGLSHLPHAVINPGDVAIVPEPGYQAYLGGSILAGAEVHVVPLRRDQGFLVDLDQLPEAVLRRARIVFLNYPNNPTAAIAPRDYLERTLAVCRRHDILLAYDNAYCDITFDGYVAPSIFEFAGARDVAVEFFSLSKSFSLTGWRIGFAVGRAELIGALTRVKSYVDTGPWLAVQKAGAAALDQAERLVRPIREAVARRRDAAVTALREAGFEVDVPQAAMYLWVALPAGMASAAFARRALETSGVVVLPGSAFGPAGEGYFRIALVVGEARLAEAAARLGRMLEQGQRGALATTA
ncbi:MAG TPA: aminotransferase class I/II-fold pyridoxal phosphate-dependent enzyme [Gemmatimonadales bacterium]|nr:aminotransferase class I/II-fold pyridoxal phosphate-dependent enzyme [Gemmatimonadales bacterium]